MAVKSQVKRLPSSLKPCFNICKTEQQASESLPVTEETCEDGKPEPSLMFCDCEVGRLSEDVTHEFSACIFLACVCVCRPRWMRSGRTMVT